MRGLLLSAYDAVSHRRWRACIEALDLDVTVLTLPPRHFAWRVRGNPLTWSQTERATLEAGYDVVVATSTVDLATLRGLVPALAAVPTLVYFHENQFVYPTRSGELDANLLIRDLYTAMAADRIVFNSAWNRDSFLDGVARFLGRLPDFAPVPDLGPRCAVLPVPLEDRWFQDHEDQPGLHVLWNHRWEHDKAPEVFFDAVRRAVQRRPEIRLHIVGQRFRSWPSCFDVARNELAAHIDTWGYVDDLAEYRALLRSCDVVVSTAAHEFQGLAVAEAIASGCRPLVPDRLAYPEYVPDVFRYTDVDDLVERLVALPASDAAPSVADLHVDRLGPRYEALLHTTASGSQR